MPFLTKLVKLIPYFWRYPTDFFLFFFPIPAYPIFTYRHSILKLWAGISGTTAGQAETWVPVEQSLFHHQQRSSSQSRLWMKMKTVDISDIAVVTYAQ
jgi:hypothetical protein